MTDKSKLEKFAVEAGYEVISKPKSMIVHAWRRRFVFDEEGFVVKVQDVRECPASPNGLRYYDASTEEGVA